MKKTALLTAFLAGSMTICNAQTIIQRDPEIESMTKEVNADSLQSYIKTMVAFGTRSTVSSTTDRKKGIGAAREWVLMKFNQFAAASGGRLSAFVDTSTYAPDGRRVKTPINLGNTVATLKGTDPNDNRIFIISGHLDSRRTDVMDGTSDAPGANDDGSGSAAVIECARVMSKHSFPATIIFVTVSGEEQGLLGSRVLANKAKAQNWNVDAMLNNDIVGNTHGMETDLKDNRSVRVFSEGVPSVAADDKRQVARLISLGGENDSPSRELARYVKETAERYVDQLDVKLIYRRDRYLRGGDHVPFLLQGFTAVRFTEMNEDFNRQHQNIRTENGVDYGDLPDFVDFNYVQKVARMNLSVLANLASAPAEPLNVGIVTSNLTNKTELKWEAPKIGKKPVGYYILMRET
ncbi:MAG TPA: M20/M25/M40 family metallo-hydrolase, partial [Puia sp.]